MWIPLLSQIELAIGLISGSLPGIAKMLHFFDDPPNKPSSQRGEEGWAAPQSIGGSPLDGMHAGTGSLHGSRHSRLCHSEKGSGRRTSVPKLSIAGVKRVWKIKTVH